MKKTVLRYLTLATTLISAILVFCHWFRINIPGLEIENHSFMTIPILLEDAAGFLTSYGGKSSAIMIIILGGILKYMCILSAGLALCGIWKTCIKERKSRFIFSAQVIALSLNLLAIITMLGANLIIAGIVEINNIVTPTVWLILSVVFSVGALVSLRFYNKFLSD